MKRYFSISLSAVLFLFLALPGCKEKTPPPEQQTQALPPGPVQSQSTPLTIDLPQAPSGNAGSSANAAVAANKINYSWNLTSLRGASAERIYQEAQACAAKVDISSWRTVDPDLLGPYEDFQVCQAAAQNNKGPCQNLRSLSPADRNLVAECEENAWRMRLMHALATGRESSCMEGLLKLAPFALSVSAKEACSLFFEAHRSGSVSPIKKALQGGIGVEAETFYWMFGAQGCAQKVSGRAFNAEECRVQGSVFQAVQDQNPAGCKGNAQCVEAITLDRSSCQKLRQNIAIFACFEDLEKNVSGSIKFSDRFFTELTRAKKSLKLSKSGN